jgi:leader peptidase (prepilin peptidase)/N-methyltransferase
VVLFVLICTVVGLVVGAWANQLIVRAPERDLELRVSLLAPPLATLPSTRREQIVIAVMGLSWAAMALRFGVDWTVAPYLAGVTSMVAVSFIDLDTMRIPDRITFPTMGIVAALVVAVALGIDDVDSMLGSAIGALAFSGVLFVLWFIYPKGMGFGDVKYAVVLGALVGWISPLLVSFALLASSLLGTIVGIAVIVRAGDRKKAFPFGPWLCLGTAIVICFSDALLP